MFSTVACVLWANVAMADDTSASTALSGKSRADNEQLTPFRLDDKYLRNDIPNDGSQDTLTLKGAVEVAATRNKDVQEAKLQVSRYKWEYLATQSSRLPNVKVLSYLADQAAKSALVPAKTDAFYFVSAMFPVTQQYRIGLEARAINLGREIAAQKLRQQMDETRAKVKAAYYLLAQDQSHLADIQDSIRYLLELQTTVADQVTKGNSLKVEAMEVAARLAKAQFEETKASNAYNIDQEKFNHVLGRELKASIRLEVIPPAEDLELDVAQAEQRALAMRPEVHQADARVRQLHLEKKILMSEYIPNVSVGVVYVGLPGYNNQVLSTNFLAPGIFINWNAFDWGRKAMLAKSRGKVEEGAKIAADNTREEVLIDLHTQVNKMTESRQLLSAMQLSRVAARESMRVSLNRYKRQATRLADVLQAQSSLADANNGYHQALLAFWQAKADFERAVGAEN